MNYAATAYFFHINNNLNQKLNTMNTNNKSLEWWNNLSQKQQYELSVKHFEMVPHTLNNAAIEELHGMYNGEFKKEDQHPYVKIAIREHTNDVLASYPNIHMTPESEESYIRGFLKGAMYGMDKAKEILKEEAPTVFLNETKKEEIVLDEENARTLHY